MASSLRRTRLGLPWLDPVQAYRRLRHLRPVLLDGRGEHPEARRAYLALGAAWEARLRGGRLEVRHDDGRAEVHDGDALGHVRRLAQQMHVHVEEPEGFTGGLVGYFGYEFLAAVEPTLPVHEAATPDALLRLCRDAVVFDRDAGAAWLWSADLPGEHAAATRMAAIVSAWKEAAQDGDARTGRAAPEGAAWRSEAPLASTGGAQRAAVVGGPAAAQAGAEGLHARLAGGAATVAGAAADADAWTPSLDQTAFESAVVALQRRIAAGDLFQANIATRFTAPCRQDPVDLFEHLATANPSPFMALIEADDHAVVSCSPEQLLRVQDGRITTRPIAGTRPRGASAEEDDLLEQELLRDEKENAEHTMLIDLLRNDVAKVSVPGTVRVPERASVERYRHVMHLVSRVEGDVRPGTGFVDWLCALFPGGTVTGAPKHRACMRIHEAEPVARGPYTGSAGYLSWSHNAHWNIMIRTLVLRDGHAHVHAGSGIVADSRPPREWDEAGHKARALLRSATRSQDAAPGRLGQVTRHGSWSPARPRRVGPRRVLIIDNYDSFTHNLADACAALGAWVQVVRNDGDWAAVWRAMRPTHVVLSPGPGRPEESGATIDVLARADVPVLGVCLGHQAMGVATGARVVAVAPVHGKTAAIHHDGRGLLAGLDDPFTAARYHSLVVDRAGLPAYWRPTAWLADGTLMAMEHRQRPWHGLQFHPESLCTDVGLEILARFLETEDGRPGIR